MELALKEGWKYQGLTLPNPAVGCVVVDKNRKILAVEAHKKAGEPHAEVKALKTAFITHSQDKNLGKKLEQITKSCEIHQFLLRNTKDFFLGGTIYVTLEPCNHQGKTPPCSKLIRDLGFAKVVFSVLDPNKKASGGGEFLRANGLEVVSGVKENEGLNLLEPFLKIQEKNFVLFKIAQRLNGTYTNGAISSKRSFVDVHHLRERIDLIVVGGETVRTDRPTLDARMVSGKAPDVFILSKQKEFDRTIPLFNVKNRAVIIGDDIVIIDNYKYVLIEGGERIFTSFKKKIHWALLYQSSRSPSGQGTKTMKSGKTMETMELEYLHTELLGKDLKIWGRVLH